LESLGSSRNRSPAGARQLSGGFYDRILRCGNLTSAEELPWCGRGSESGRGREGSVYHLSGSRCDKQLQDLI
jgi:hypothetical protein